jgi:glycosyltransferase involved in cell wall biosynthesis
LIVALSPFDTYPPRSGAAARTFNFLFQLSRYDSTRLLYLRNYFDADSRVKKEKYSENFFGIAFAMGQIASAIDRFSGAGIILKARSFAYPSCLKETLERHLQNSRLLIFECPESFKAVRKSCLREHVDRVIYDAHNVEYDLIPQVAKGMYSLIGRSVFSQERDLCEMSQAVLVVSNEDRIRMSRLYGISENKIYLLPNGVNTDDIRPATKQERLVAKKELNLDHRPIALFIGSPLKANVDALEFTENLAITMKQFLFLIVGKVSKFSKKRSSNVVSLGEVTDEIKLKALAAADIAINPVNKGAGTNVKMLEYLSAGLPIVTTPIGSRGLQLRNEALIVRREEFAQSIENIANHPELAKDLGIRARELAMKYDWRYLVNKVWLDPLSKIFFS